MKTQSTQNTAAHTPGPWTFDRETFEGRIENLHIGANGTHICAIEADRLGAIAEANAALIVLAVNNHERLERDNAALRAALRALVDHADFSKESGAWCTRFNFDSPAMAQARAALGKGVHS
jgi:hypothetical protein